ncbi:MAG: Gfo/Idh/MocA family oxidoreductase [Candidatus Omnitrophica bacterium]|nr:Gfo/Idh/MocA family oxidoreductase [Candidatus Omnitrophota bacterium]
MKLLVIGGGSIGKRCMRNLISIGIQKENITVVETRADRQQEIRETIGIQNFYTDLDKALKAEKYYAGFICAPTHLHIPIGIKLAQNGVHMLMEKPLAHNLDGIEALKTAVEENQIVVAMAYIFRYHPGIQKVKELLDAGAIGKVITIRGEFSEYLPDWHPWEDYRSFYMAKKSTGGGSILDQCHIMDLTHYLIGEFDSVFAVNTKLSSLEIEADDIAEMIVTFKNGVVGSIHTDIFGRDHKKYLEIKGEEGNLYWDFYANEVQHYEAKTKCKHFYRKFPTDFNLCYIQELKNFLAACEGKEEPKANLQVGIETMELILSAEKSQVTRKFEKISSSVKEIERVGR